MRCRTAIVGTVLTVALSLIASPLALEAAAVHHVARGTAATGTITPEQGEERERGETQA